MVGSGAGVRRPAGARARDRCRRTSALARAYAEQGMIVRSEVLRAEVELARARRPPGGGARPRCGWPAPTWRSGWAPTRVRAGSSTRCRCRSRSATSARRVPGDSASTRKDLEAARKLLRGRRDRGDAFAGLHTCRRWAWSLGPTGWTTRCSGVHGNSTSIMAVASMNVFAGGADRAAAGGGAVRGEGGGRGRGPFRAGRRARGAAGVRGGDHGTAAPLRPRSKAVDVGARGRADHRGAVQDRRGEDDRPARRGDRPARGGDPRAGRARRGGVRLAAAGGAGRVVRRRACCREDRGQGTGDRDLEGD